ncbi:MAG: YqeG family HAD IIIA-type phosphatase [Thermosynechococcaceae cyanobacterium]
MPSPGFMSLLQPDLILEDRILKLTPALLSQLDLQGLVLDVDDTIVASRARDMLPEFIDWLQDVKQVVQVSLVSNNISRNRIARIADSLDVPYAFGAGKPSRRKLRPVVAQMGLPFEQVAMVGDRIFTDVLAGNRLGMFTILVDPVDHASVLRTIEIKALKCLSAYSQSSIH